MKNLLLAAIVLAPLGYLLYRRSAMFTGKDQTLKPFQRQNFGALNMESIIEWFVTQNLPDFETEDIVAVAVNLGKAQSGTTNPPDEFAALLKQVPRGQLPQREAILLGFFNNKKAELVPPPHAIIFTADELAPTLKSHFKDKAIIILE